MSKQTVFMVAGICGCAGLAQAGIAAPPSLGIFAPCDDAQAEIFWVGSNAGYTGELSWINPDFEQAPVSLWTNHNATEGQSFILPRLFAQGERLDFSYKIIAGQYDFFSTADERDWPQFTVDASNPLDVLVGIEDIRLPRGDGDHNDAVFRVVFTHPNVPAPGAIALLGGGCLVMSRRRR